MADFDLGSFEVAGAGGLDSLFQREAHLVTPVRRKVASVSDLKPFMRVSSEMLVHKSQRDLWALKKQADGTYFIERLFDDTGEPLKY